MLSSPLNVAIPANMPVFLERLLERAVQSPTCGNIRYVHRVLSGLGSNYLDDLPPNTLTRFQNILSELLAKSNINDPFASLLCLAVLAKFAARPCDALAKGLSASKGLPTMEGTILTEPFNIFSPARKFFFGVKTQKTLNLVVLKVIKAFSRNSSLKLSEALQTSSLSQEIIDAVCTDDKQCWMIKNQAKMRNLYEKILRPEIDVSLQCAVRIANSSPTFKLILI